MEQHGNNCGRRGMTRRSLFGLGAACALAAAFPRQAHADLFGGDIGVLLAQLEQQLLMVSKAIETVQGIVATVERLQRVAEQGKTMLQKVSGQQGLKGFLSGLKELTNTGRGAIRNLQNINVRGGQWKTRLQGTHGDLSTADVAQLTIEGAQMNQRFLRDVGNLHKSFEDIAQSVGVDAMEAMNDAVQEASSVDGIVGQTQLLGRQVAQLGLIAAQHTAATTTHASLYTSELERQAMRRAQSEQVSKSVMRGFETPSTSQPVELPWNLDSGW